MRNAAILIFLTVFQVFANDSYSQKTRLNLSLNDVSVENVLTEIENQSEFYFLCNKKLVDVNRKVNVHVEDLSIDQILGQLFIGTGVDFLVIDKQIILSQKKYLSETRSKLQLKTVTGRVSDEQGNPLIGVTVMIEGTQTGSITDTDGKYSIDNVPPDGILVFSYVGMETQEVETAGKTQIDVVLQESLIGLEEIVVTGYAAQRKKDITGAVTVVDVESLQSLPTRSGVDALQGMASGVNIISSGAPGSTSQIFIRGISSFGDTNPLVLVDGVEASLDNINANDIESIQVLKDAGAAAIYGVRGSNGVIIVTTKKGKSSTPVLTYDAYAGVQTPFRGNPLGMTNSNDFVRLWNQVFPSDNTFADGIPDYMYRDASEGFSQWASEGDPEVDPANYNFDAGDPIKNYIIAKTNRTGTNWYQEVFNPAWMFNHNLAVSGRTDKSSYLVSFNYLDQKGTLMETFFKRYAARINTEYHIGKNIRIGENLYIYNTSANGYSNRAERNAIMFCIRANPLSPVTDIEGNYAGTFSLPVFGNWANPVAQQKFTDNNRDNTWAISGNAYVEVDFLNHFSARTSLGGRFSNRYRMDFTYTDYTHITHFAAANSLDEQSNNSLYGIWTNTLNYSNNFGNHRLSVLAGSEAIEYSGRSIQGTRSDYFSTMFEYLILQNGSMNIDNSSNAYANTLFSLFSRLDYSFSDKYLLGLTVRRDGSSKFGADSKYGVFPSVSLGWRISEESFLNGIAWLNDLKLRGSYGELGNQSNISPDNAYTLFGSQIEVSYYDLGITNNSSQQGFYQTRMGNTNTSWERDIITNLGIDATLFNRVTLSAEYYKKSIDGLLFPQPLPATAGGAAPPSINIGDIQNTGLDISASYRSHFGQDWYLSIGANLTSYENKVVSIPGAAGFFDSGNIGRIGTLCRNQEDQPVGSFFGYEVIGLFQSDEDVAASPVQADASPGQFKYRDVDGDDEITPDDRTFIGDPNPDFTYGINLELKYKDFDLSAIFYGSEGNEVYNMTKFYTHFLSYYRGGLHNDILNAWSPTNTESTIPVLLPSTSFSQNIVPNSWFIEDGSFFKCRSLALGYALPEALVKALRINKFRIYLQVYNLFQITKYSGLDPEVPGGTTAFGVDFGNYPNNQRQFLAGVNVSF